MGLKAKCRICKDVIHSLFRHDFLTCKCGSIFVDGGNDYFRCGFPPGNKKCLIVIKHKDHGKAQDTKHLKSNQ